MFRRSDPVISASRGDACGRPTVARDRRLCFRDTHRTAGLNPQTGHGNDYRPPASPIFRTRSEVILEWRSTDYHRAAAARARGLLAEATTPWLKQRLADTVARHEQIAAAIETASDPDAG
jgi:hypothetical protein